MNISIIYTSQTGNTKEVAEMINEVLIAGGHNTTCINIYHEKFNDNHVKDKDLILFGAYTWGNGKLPEEMRNCLKYIIKEKQLKLPKVAVFGTGETMWTYYCRAVDEMEYHLSKVTTVLGKLKIEQSPRGNQKHLPIEFINKILREV